VEVTVLLLYAPISMMRQSTKTPSTRRKQHLSKNTSPMWQILERKLTSQEKKHLLSTDLTHTVTLSLAIICSLFLFLALPNRLRSSRTRLHCVTGQK